MSEPPWLRELVGEDEVGLLFEAQGEDLKRTIRNVLELASRHSDVENRLLDLLEMSVEHGNDDTCASMWIALILGELESKEAIPILINALSSQDEALAEAAVDALKRIGEAAFDTVIEHLEGNYGTQFELFAYRVLEGATSWEHPYLLEEVRDFMLNRLSRPEMTKQGIERAALVTAHLGDRRAIEPMRRLLKERFKNVNPALRDSLEMLQENENGQPIQRPIPPWGERLSWLKGDKLQPFRNHDML